MLQHNLTYRQTFQAGAFSAANISALKIDKSMLGQMKDYVLKVSFVRADGTVVSNWGGWVLAVLGGDKVTLFGPEFDWSSEFGDLTLQLEVVMPGKGGGLGQGFAWGKIDDSSGGPPWAHGNEAYTPPPPSAPTFVSQPAVRDIVDVAAVVPEPSSWLMMIGGFMGAGAVLRRARALRPALAPCRTA